VEPIHGGRASYLGRIEHGNPRSDQRIWPYRRNILRAIAETSGRKDIEVVGINDLGPVETNAHLLRFDSVHGRFPGTVTVDGDSISVGNGKIKVSAERDPSKLPWKELGVDIAM